MYQRILVPLDGSPTALRAIGPARRLARLHHASLWLVTIAPPGPASASEAQRIIDHGRKIADDPNTLGEVIVSDDPAAELARLDHQHPDALLCMTTSGRHPIGRLLLGSVAREVIRRSDQATVLVGPACSTTGDAPVDRIVACLDGTPDAEVILEWASGWSRATATAITLLHVIYPLAEPPASEPPTREQREQLRYVRSVAKRLRDRDHVAVGVRIAHSHPPDAILDFAEDFPHAVLAVATSSPAPLSDFVFGSVTTQLIRKSTAPVLIASKPGTVTGA